MKEIFVPQRFAGKSEALLTKINTILEDYASQGYSLTVRQLYYQLVTINAIPNNQQTYKNIVALVNDARLAGRIDWDAIVDRARALLRPRNWEDAPDALRWVHGQFQIDKWKDQAWHVEIMVEKQALEGVLEPICSRLDVAFTANKGYSSATMMYEAGKRMERKAADGKKLLVCYLGDHDPSGIDMTRDVTERLDLFSRSTEIRVNRLALNMPQVRRYSPPENPTKQTDSRTPDYINKFGQSCWELDALNPDVISKLIEAAVLKVRDEELWEKAVREEALELNRIDDAITEMKNPFDRAKLAADIREAEVRLAESRIKSAVEKATEELETEHAKQIHNLHCKISRLNKKKGKK